MTKEEYFERRQTEVYYGLVPRERVELDMMCGDGIVSSAARSYFREYYATPEQRVKMDLDDLMNRIGAITIVAVTIVLIIVGAVQQFIK